ncbi:MAG: hypothetical protein ACI8PZ_001006 [Myxococcota bacterium]|jgi:hypothetical protein
MSTLVIAAVAFGGGLVLSSLFFAALWWAFRKTVGLVKMVVGWLVTIGLLAVAVAAVYLLAPFGG